MPIFNQMLLNVGAMKTGTSWLYEMLKDNPDLDTVPIKEIHYFAHLHGGSPVLTEPGRTETVRRHVNRVMPKIPYSEIPALMDWFKRYLAGPIDDAWFANLFMRRGEAACCAEFSNLNARLPRAGWDHVRTVVKNVRVSYGLRSPMQRMWSHARFHAKVVGKSSELPSWGAPQFTRFLTERGCIRNGAYSETIGALDDILGRENCLFWDYSQIKEDPGALLRGFETFLGIGHVAYTAERLAVQHNATVWLPPPAAFTQAATPFIRKELDALDRLKMEIPKAWGKDSPHAPVPAAPAARANA